MANSTPATQHMIRVVAEKFEVKGWKPGQFCHGHHTGGVCSKHHLKWGHELEPPDLLSPDGAWALWEALIAKGHWIISSPRWIMLAPNDVTNGYKVHFDSVVGGKILALLTAAFQLTEERRR